MRVTVDALRRKPTRFKKPQTWREVAILDAATQVFGAKGYKAARTADIASAAGVTERTLFRYFPTKEALYQRVMAPAIIEAAFPRELADTGRLFGDASESLAQWERRILKTRLDIVTRSAPQFQLLVATLITDAKMRRKVIKVWKEKILSNALLAIRRYQDRGELRKDLSPETIARAVISLNVSYLLACALIAPEADWDHEAEIEATVDMLLNGVRAR
jgi:TetR/AcrR family transcriptional regulator